MKYPELFNPIIGETYTNRGGGTFRCLWSSDADADFINTKSGWKFQAHGCRLYEDGTIEWDYSTGGYFDEEFLKMKFNTKYVMIITSEDSRYQKGEKSLGFYADNPHEGLLQDIVFGNTFDELFADGENEGLFYQLYSTSTGERISSGILDPDSPQEEIDDFERRSAKI